MMEMAARCEFGCPRHSWLRSWLGFPDPGAVIIYFARNDIAKGFALGPVLGSDMENAPIFVFVSSAATGCSSPCTAAASSLAGPCFCPAPLWGALAISPVWASFVFRRA